MVKIKIDKIDLKILEALVDDGRIIFKDLAKKLDIDERMIARRMNKLKEIGVIKKFTIDIDWSKLGFESQAYVGTRTAVGEGLRKSLFEFFDKQPNIVYVDSTVGSYEYVFYTICKDLQEFRTKIASPLESLTAGLLTSVVSHHFKPIDCKTLLNIVTQQLDAQDSQRLEE